MKTDTVVRGSFDYVCPPAQRVNPLDSNREGKNILEVTRSEYIPSHLSLYKTGGEKRVIGVQFDFLINILRTERIGPCTMSLTRTTVYSLVNLYRTHPP